MKDSKLSRYTGFNIAISHNFSFAELQLDLGYFKATAEDVSEISALDENGSYSLHDDADILVQNYPIDLFVSVYKNSWFNSGIGPSMVITNRQIDLYYINDIRFRDKISSIGLGLAAFVNLRIQVFAELENFIFLVGLKVRKINSVYMITEGRKTGNYKINFFQNQFNIGFSWQF
jgi:hypothetical protein